MINKVNVNQELQKISSLEKIDYCDFNQKYHDFFFKYRDNQHVINAVRN